MLILLMLIHLPHTPYTMVWVLSGGGWPAQTRALLSKHCKNLGDSVSEVRTYTQTAVKPPMWKIGWMVCKCRMFITLFIPLSGTVVSWWATTVTWCVKQKKDFYVKTIEWGWWTSIQINMTGTWCPYIPLWALYCIVCWVPYISNLTYIIVVPSYCVMRQPTTLSSLLIIKEMHL